MLTDAPWAMLEPLVETCPEGQDPAPGPAPHAVRDRVAAPERGQVARRSRRTRAVVARGSGLYPLRLGVWEQLLSLVQERGVQTGRPRRIRNA